MRKSRLPKAGARNLLFGLLALLLATTGAVATPGQSTASPSLSVQEVQQNLAGLGYLPWAGVDGVDGPQTSGAITKFQSAQCLAVDGIAGPNTTTALMDKVEEVQRAAHTIDDGVYGMSTLHSVAIYQFEHNLTHDGIAGPRTMSSMGIERRKGCSDDVEGLPYPSSYTHQVQWNLAGMGYLPWSGIDGIVGPQTRSATMEFQRDACISTDAIAGPVTGDHMSQQVRKIQREAGASVDGAYGPSTRAAVEDYQRAHGLAVDGMAGPNTMSEMGIDRTMCDYGSGDPAPPADGSTRERIVAIAVGEHGYHEDGSSNCQKYGGMCEPWCAKFGTWVWQQAGVDVPSYWFTGNWYMWGLNNGHSVPASQGFSDIKPGDAVFWGTGPSSVSSSVHVDLVESVNADGTLNLIGGNVSNAVSRKYNIDPYAADIYGYTRP
ncbi:Peptidoglycan-binding (PGRP) domain of peptidoglycan hydrolases-containing protein [Actinopolyspora xinjiangensis]|uniref:Peptidoglycan-binding (PGRP) domain of peptidoglycan hydrolases-containing protein n=1 Tax=Actinopolyspora xinjiangensis TaxID=405564 RepID=A0A1H0W8L4_9ACTN|nr:peptidoglycan-binding protein [Actinopolyspora xinjiangensis]SDP87057.1 Peptidoglycan-binding (PGRP) domain of peptidoglycan hydrolases-containing protein [Actinopolyspora xinjiangensis]